MSSTKPQYVIRLNSGGYYGTMPYTAVPKSKAITFHTMKDARASQNRLNGRLLTKSDNYAEIELK